MDVLLLIAVAGVCLMLAGVLLVLFASPAGVLVVALGTGTSLSAAAMQAPTAEVRLFRWVHIAKGQPLTAKAPRGTAPAKADPPLAA